MSDEIKLTPAERELEQALRSLRPSTARIDSEAAARAAGARRVSARPRAWSYAAAAIVAVGLGVWFTPMPRRDIGDQYRNQSGAIVTSAIANDGSVPEVTWVVYRQALAKSPGELEALLDRQASYDSARRQGDGSPWTIWNANSRVITGEM